MEARQPAGSLEVRREELLARLERARPKLVALLAPAGFGKTTLIEQYLAGRGAGGILDCSGVQGDLDLARRLMRALAQASPIRERDLAERELALSDGSRTLVERIGAAIDAWREPVAGTIVFEQAEALAGSPSARALFAQLLDTLPEGRCVAICAREHLRLHWTRFAAPHEIVVFRAGDLAFDADDVRSIFAPGILDASTVERILAASRGWPIAVLLLRRFAAEGRIDELLEQLGDVAFEELHDYLVDEVLASLDEGLAAGVFACAAIPGATAADLRAAFPDDTTVAQLERFARESPFLTRESDGTFAVHPILATLLNGRHRERRVELLATVAMRHEASGELQRAAELHLARGDREAAADALGRHQVSLDGSLTPAYARVLAGLDRASVLRYPRLWGATCLRRLHCAEMATLLDEAESVWRMMPPTASVLERFDVVALRVRLTSEAGRLDDSSAILQQFAAGTSETPGAPLDSWIAYLRALLAARRGQLAEAERVLTAALPMVANNDLLACETFFVLGAEIARVRGQRALERQFLDRADDLARRSSLGNVVALVLAEAAFGAWLAGEDAVVSPLAEELSECVRRGGVTGLKYLALTLAGSGGEPERADAPRHVALARVIAAARHAGDPNGARYAREARQAARAYHSPFVECLAELCTAFCEPEEFEDAVLRAADAAGRCDSPALRSAVESIARREEECGMLDPFAQRFARARRGSAAPLEVEMAVGTVRVHGRDTALAGREAELLFALASRRETTARTRLAALLWPETGEDAGRNALSVCLHRLRRSLGAEAVVRDGDGYRLCDGASVDLWGFERKLAAVRDGALDESGRAKLAQIALQLEATRPDRMERWEWFAPVARRLDAIRVEVAQRLGIDALERGDPRDALERAAAVLAHDPFDEPAREMTIRAHLALDDRAAALRSYRQYREMLRTELQCEPSPALTRMVNS